MKEKSPWLAPSCASLKPRLYQIGVTEFSGAPEELNIAVLAGCFAGEFYNRLSSRPAAARKIAWELKKLLGQKKTEKAALDTGWLGWTFPTCCSGRWQTGRSPTSF